MLIRASLPRAADATRHAAADASRLLRRLAYIRHYATLRSCMILRLPDTLRYDAAAALDAVIRAAMMMPPYAAIDAAYDALLLSFDDAAMIILDAVCHAAHAPYFSPILPATRLFSPYAISRRRHVMPHRLLPL